MRSLRDRLGPLALAAAVLGGWQAVPRAEPAAPRAVIAPGPETPGAVARGAASIAAAQKLARAGKVAEAVALFEQVAASHPSVVHDCNLSLGYLRAGRLSEAQLVWDVSQLRGVAAPDWCGPSLSAQLAGALRDRHFVPLAVQVSPPTAVIEIAGLRFRGVPFVWLPPGTYTVVARDGERSSTAAVLVAAPAATVAVRIEEPVVAPPVATAVDPVPPVVDAAATPIAPHIEAVAPPVDAAVAMDVAPRAARPRWPAYAGAGVGAVGVGAGLLFHLRAVDTRDRADRLTSGSTAFAAERDRFGTQRALALTGYAVGAAALGFAAYWWLTSPSDDRRAPALGVTVDGGGATFTLEGVLP